MRTIGITGGIGAGKSQVLEFLSNHYACRVLYTDLIAKRLEEPGEACYRQVVNLLGEEILENDGKINNKKMAEAIFHNPSKLEGINRILHPAVMDYVKQEIAREREKGELSYLFVEAALLIECGYDRILDEIWYVYASEKTRRERLKASRGYSDEKVDAIFEKQLSEAIFRKNCSETIRNDGTIEELEQECKRLLGEYTS